jgi:sugar lactone lactonase YvrE
MRQVCLATLLMVPGPLVGSDARAAAGPFPDYIPLNASAGEYPVGVAADKKGNVYVSIGGLFTTTSGAIYKFAPSGERSVFADFSWMPGGIGGLAVDAVGSVYAAAIGVWRVDTAGNAELLPGTEAISFPNKLAFDQEGNLYITQSFSLDPPLAKYAGGWFGRGGIWRIPRGGRAELWLRDELLSGLGIVFPFPLGANGIAYYHGALYVANSERGTVVKVPVLPNGAPGTIEVAAHLPEPFPGPLPPGAEGIALDVHGDFYLAMPSHNVVMRLSRDGQSWNLIATASDNLDIPATVAFGTGKGERTSLFITSQALFPGGVGPGLAKVDTGVAGLPLP